MSSAFQLSSAYRPYRPPPTDVSTMVAGIATRTAATSSFPAQPWANEAVSRRSSDPQGSAPDQGLERCQQQHPQQHDTDEFQLRAGSWSTAQTATRPIPTTTSTRRRPAGVGATGRRWLIGRWRCGRVGEKVQGGRHQVHLCA